MASSGLTNKSVSMRSQITLGSDVLATFTYSCLFFPRKIPVVFFYDPQKQAITSTTSG